MADTKVRVTKLFGAGSCGAMNPKVGLVCQEGTITAMDSGNYQVTVSGQGLGTTTKYYPFMLHVLESVASGSHAYPTGDGAIVYGHDTTPVGIGTGMAYSKGGEPTLFSR